VSSFYVLFTCTLKAQNNKLVHVSTTASSSSAMLEKHGSTKSNVSSRIESSQVEFEPNTALRPQGCLGGLPRFRRL